MFNSNVSQSSIDLVIDVLRGGMLSSGKMNEKFENELKRVLGINHLFTVNSGTSALHLSLILAGVKAGDEVIISAQTFVATGLAVLYCGAKVVFADINLHDGNISVDAIKKVITPKTKAIIPVHWGGYPCDLEEINILAKQHGIMVIEDAAHALGAFYKNVPIGNYSDFTAFSFQAIKSLTTGDGGAIATNLPALEILGRRLAWFGIDRERNLPDETGERQYLLTQVGYKYHLNDIAAAIGLGGLQQWNQSLQSRREIAELYQNQLQNVNGVTLLKYNHDRESSNWLFTILVERRSDFMAALRTRNVASSVVHVGIHKHPIFGGHLWDWQNQYEFDQRHVCLPIYSFMDTKIALDVISAIRKGW